MTPATGQAAASVRSYLDAANLTRPGVTQPFLASGNYADLATEFEANRMAGWIYSRDMLKLYDESIDSRPAKAASKTASARSSSMDPPPPLAKVPVDRKFPKHGRPRKLSFCKHRVDRSASFALTRILRSNDPAGNSHSSDQMEAGALT